VTLDVLQLVPGPNAEANVRPGLPASGIGGHCPRMVALKKKKTKIKPLAVTTENYWEIKTQSGKSNKQ
jgi:hypothetical protein